MPARAGVRLIRWTLRVAMALSVVASVIALGLWLRLSQGPLELPWLAAMVADRVNGETEGVSLSLQNMELSLGQEGAPAGLLFTGLTVSDGDGAPLISVPRVGARFNPGDLVQGRLRPTEITVTGAEAEVERRSDGRIRFALSEDGDASREEAAPPEAGARMDAISRIVESFAGDAQPIPQLSQLERVAILDTELTYSNPATGRVWRSERADLVLTRTEHGASLKVALDVTGDREGIESGASAEITAMRRRGADETEVRLAFEGMRPEYLAEELPELGWLALVEAPLSGTLRGSLSDEGEVGAIAGTLAADAGRVMALGEEGMPVDRFALEFAYEPSGRRMAVERLEIASAAADLDLSGFADLRMEDGSLLGLAAQLDIAGLRLELPDVFEGEQRFDAGQIVARLDVPSRTVEVAEARLSQGELLVSVSGRARQQGGDWISDLRIAASDLAVERLVGLWPLPAAKGAREWLAQNLKAGRVTEALAQMRLGQGSPELSLDFRFAGLETSYLKDMSPIRGGRGRGHMSLERLDLFVEGGRIEPVAGQPIQLAGSELRILDLGASPAPAVIDVAARGPTAAVLALIDQDPLNLTSKMNLDPRRVRGTATVDVGIKLPLARGLKLADLEIDTQARIANVAMPFSLKLTGEMQIASPALELAATTRRMTVKGPVTANGTPVRLDWEERYGGPDRGRDIHLTGSVTPAALSGININIPGFDGGSAAADVRIGQAPGAPTRLDVSADLAPAVVSVDPVLWAKPAGLPAKVSASGRYDERLILDKLALSGPGLEAEGSLRLFPAGGIERADIARLDMGELADVSVTAVADGEGFDLDIKGRWFDLAFLDRSREAAVPPVIPLDARYAIDQVRVSEQITLGLVQGTFRRAADSRLEAGLTGRVAGVAPVEISYEKLPSEPGKARVTSEDAGRVLEAAGLFSGAEGGRLKLKTVIAPDRATAFRGTADIRDVRVRQEARTFSRVLEEGALPEAANQTRGSGLAFERVEIPFAFRGDRIEIGTALATSPSLAIKTTGLIDERTGRLRLRGVISPAYALTGVLNNVPLVGTLLGGEGEGLLAMTFQVTGSIDSPEIVVNPLTLLAPGFLRNVFEGGAFTEIGPPPETATTASRINRAAQSTRRPPSRTPDEKAAADAEQARRLRELLSGDY